MWRFRRILVRLSANARWNGKVVQFHEKVLQGVPCLVRLSVERRGGIVRHGIQATSEGCKVLERGP